MAYTKPLDPTLITDAVREKFLAKVQVVPGVGYTDAEGTYTDCVLCNPERMYIDDDGYGQFYLAGRMRKAHHIGSIIYHGTVPGAGLVVDHKCKRRGCVYHVEPCTQRENVRRGDSPVGRIMRGEPICTVR